ncbi:uncharacterized protein SRS1_11346 [Sporisorium reilianum f. sp. reilianum]|uniref:Transglycosylase SLT domain-containing protein n=1 Tax=Sporisorium reilianum f. sp. reilianum TaxID=72559 RepID=A0A2N8UNW1_9BASI|nr:uncharacterized protein SRS1_11346 [Sporisorium reilianum f. sp. reilianum]
MKFLSLVAATLALVATTVSADPSIDALNLPAMSKHPLSMQRRDAILNRRYSHNQPRVTKRHFRGSKRSCKAKTKHAASGAASGAGAQAVSSSKQNSQSKSDSDSNSQSSSSGKSDSKADSSSSSSSSAASGAGLFGFSYGNCGSSDANDNQPNGSQNFLNCGLTSGGWNPPKISLDQLKILSATQAAASSVFAPCKDNLWAFQAAEKAHGIPATVLMSFAMQESTCNPGATGGNGEQGLMQITPDKCGGAPNGNCKDPWFNVDTGAKYFKSTLDQCGGNLLQAMGQYNGWSIGLTVQKATAAKWQGNCYAQNNLDYLYQMLNGWFLGKSNAYDMGTYHNLASC